MCGLLSVLFIVILGNNLCSFEFDIGLVISLARLYKFSYEKRKSGKQISISINIKHRNISWPHTLVSCEIDPHGTALSLF